MGHGTEAVVARPGWYPDPWSTDPVAQRWFDGVQWSAATRSNPTGASTTEPTHPPPPTRPTRPSRRHRRRTEGRQRLRWILITEIVVLLLVVALVLGPRIVADLSARFTGWAQGLGSEVPDADTGRERAVFPSTTEASPLGTPPAPPAETGEYAFLDVQPNEPNRPVAWDPCRPVRYVINPTGAPTGGTERVEAAIARISSASGLVFEFGGYTDETPQRTSRDVYLPDRYDPTQWAPVLISWSDEATIPELGAHVVGWGGPRGVVYDGRAVYVTGTVILDRADLSTDSERERAETEATILHELAHVVGLDHVGDRHELMHASSDGSVLDFGRGDRHGLAALGAQACHPDLVPGPTR